MSFTIRPEFWGGKRVFVTGHNGFMGSWLVLWLYDLGAKVTGFSLPERPHAHEQQSLFDTAALSACCQIVDGDVRDFTALRVAITQAQPDIVIHLAASPPGPHALAHPRDTFDINMQGTLNLLEACRTAASPGAVIVATSDRVYEDRQWCYAYRETDRLGGASPFDASKVAAEMVVRSYQEQFKDHGLLVASARFGNVVGGGDWGIDGLVPDAVRAFADAQRLQVALPEAVRSWLHVVEPLSGLLMLARALFEQGAYFATGWNFAPDPVQVAQMGKVADILAEAWGDGAHWETVVERENARQPAWLCLDATRAKSELGWRASGNLHGSLRSTVRFYRACAFSATPEAVRDLMRSDRTSFAEANLWESLS